MVTHREILVVRRPGNRSVDVRKPPAVRLVPGPDLRWSIIERGGHGSKLRALRRAYDCKARSASRLPLAPVRHQFFEFMSPRSEREHSSFGKHCSVVRLKAKSSSQAGWPNGCCSGLSVICNRDRCDLNYSFFGLELHPYQQELGSLS